MASKQQIYLDIEDCPKEKKIENKKIIDIRNNVYNYLKVNEEISYSKLLCFKSKGVIIEDFINYKKPNLYICNSICANFKCEKEYGEKICQNSKLYNTEVKYYQIESLINHYVNNEITKAIVFNGFENFDEFEQLYNFIEEFRKVSDDDIVIYTGYYPEELNYKLKVLECFDNIIIKFGRYVPNQEKRFDELLGVTLASDNQYALTLEEALCKLK